MILHWTLLVSLIVFRFYFTCGCLAQRSYATVICHNIEFKIARYTYSDRHVDFFTNSILKNAFILSMVTQWCIRHIPDVIIRMYEFDLIMTDEHINQSVYLGGLVSKYLLKYAVVGVIYIWFDIFRLWCMCAFRCVTWLIQIVWT